jgi:hypothetical protein
MNDGTGGRRRRQMRGPRTGWSAVVAGIALLAAACSGSPSAGSGSSSAPPGSASSSPSPGSSSATVRPATLQKQVVAYANCMRSHGVPMPLLPVPPSKHTAKPAPVIGPNPGSPQWQAAQQTCHSLLPPPVKDGPGPGGSAGG